MHLSPYSADQGAPQFALVLARDRRRWPRCLLWHGWLPLVCVTPWLPSLGQLADRALESSLGAYPADHDGLWVAPDLWDADDLALEMVEDPNIRTDGSREDHPVGGFEFAGAGVYLPALPVGLHAAEASFVSASSLGVFRAVFIRSVWSGKMLLMPLWSLAFWMVLLVWIQPFISFGLGYA